MATLPIAEFLKQRLSEYDPDFELRKGTGFESLFFKPLQFIVQPLRDEADQIQTAQSFRRILQTEEPDDFDEEAVDGLVSNLFVERVTGSRASGVARAYFSQAVEREYPAGGAVFVGNNGVNYSNPSPFLITRGRMGGQIENGLYYFDIPVRADQPGKNTNLEEGGLVSLLNDPDAVSVTNKSPLAGGLNKESNTELIERTKNSVAVRDLVVGKGFNGILFESFAGQIRELQQIGMGDEEMMRDVIFNTHIGGKIDGYFAGANLKIGEADFVGLLIDTTRQAKSSKNLELTNEDWKELGNGSIDRSDSKIPIVRQVKPKSKATYLSPVDLSNPIDLTNDQRIKMTVDGITREFRVAGASVGATTRNEVVNLINNAFGVDVAFPEGDSFILKSTKSGSSAEVILDDPDTMTSGSALAEVFGLAEGSGPYIFKGDGPIEFVEALHYEIDDQNGRIRRLVGNNVLGSDTSPETSGEVQSGSKEFDDQTLAQFNQVAENDLLIVTSGSNAGQYRILNKVSPNKLEVDKEFAATETGVSYYIQRTGIKDGELVYTQYWYNPLSIDVGGLVLLDENGNRGIRPGREDRTITDTAFVRIRKIELIDPLTKEPIGQELDGTGGFGQGGFGQGAFGVGSKAEYRLVVNEPTARFSMFEDSYIVIDQAYQGLSFKVTYDWAPETEDLHNFVRSANERVLDGDILMKHFIPAFVSGEIRYSVDETDSSVPSNESLTASVKDFINSRKSGEELQYSDIIQFILRQVDPFHRYGANVEPFTLTARVHNTDGSTTVVTGEKGLEIKKPDPFPKFTKRPLSPRITHWFADEIVLVRV